jgi:hypothetical protein
VAGQQPLATIEEAHHGGYVSQAPQKGARLRKALAFELANDPRPEMGLVAEDDLARSSSPA